LKVGKPKELIGGGGTTGTFFTHAIEFITGSYIEAKPLPAALLSREFHSLREWNGSGVVKAFTDESVVDISDTSAEGDISKAPFIALEHLDGKNMRESINARESMLPVIAQLCATFERLTKIANFTHHGDLKPENVILAGGQAILIDPGYFGELPLVDGGVEAFCRVTTPAYYPSMRPDDLLALGIMLWEVILGEQPFRNNLSFRAASAANAGEHLTRYVRQNESLGTYFISPLADVPRPTEIIPSMSEDKETILLKGLGLELLADGRLELADGFTNFAEFRQAISVFK
jgi:serine/threonine protein kinase